MMGQVVFVAKNVVIVFVIAIMVSAVSAQTATQTPEARSDNVRGLFEAFLLSERSLKLLPGHMELSWQDIPALLELAKDSTQIETVNRTLGRMYLTVVPEKPVTVEPQKQAIRGMVALWLVEGIRRGHGASFRPPFYAFCFRGNRSQADCEVSEEIHRDTLAAYQRWWGAVKDMPIEQAAAVEPLQGTSLQWCGPMDAPLSPDTAQEEPAPRVDVAVAPAAPIEGLPEPPFTIEEVAAYHREQTGSTLSPEMLKRLYTSIAIHNYEHGGNVTGMKDAARRALAFQQDESTCLQLYMRLADGYAAEQQTTSDTWRINEARVLLTALRDVLKHPLPDTPPRLPSVGVYNIGGSGPAYEKALEDAKKQHDAEMAARQQAETIAELVGLRKMFTSMLVEIYGDRRPRESSELHNLALQYLGDETAAKQLHDAAESYHGPSTTIPVLRLATP